MLPLSGAPTDDGEHLLVLFGRQQDVGLEVVSAIVTYVTPVAGGTK